MTICQAAPESVKKKRVRMNVIIGNVIFVIVGNVIIGSGPAGLGDASWIVMLPRQIKSLLNVTRRVVTGHWCGFGRPADLGDADGGKEPVTALFMEKGGKLACM